MATEVEMSNSAGLAKNLKRSNKPLMERKRRCRINASLNQLKSLVLDAMNKDTSQYSKLEKADILEMTVRHLRNMQRHQLAAAVATDSTVVGKFQAGFSECAGEVSRYLSSVDGISPDIRVRLLDHLGKSVSRVITQNPQGDATVQTNSQQLHVQIPYATQATSLPGASFVTNTSQNIMNTSQNTQFIQNTSQNTRYVGAFQVVPSSALPQHFHQEAQTYVMATPTGMGNLQNMQNFGQIRVPSSPIYMNSLNSVGSGGSTASSSPSPQSSIGSRTPSPVYSEPESPVNLVKPQVIMARPVMESAEKVWRPW